MNKRLLIFPTFVLTCLSVIASFYIIALYDFTFPINYINYHNFVSICFVFMNIQTLQSSKYTSPLFILSFIGLSVLLFAFVLILLLPLNAFIQVPFCLLGSPFLFLFLLHGFFFPHVHLLRPFLPFRSFILYFLSFISFIGVLHLPPLCPSKIPFIYTSLSFNLFYLSYSLYLFF